MPKSASINGLMLEQVLDRDPLTASPDTPVREAIARMDQGQGNCILVVEGTRLVGLLSAREIVKLAASATDFAALTLAEVMQPIAITLTFSKAKLAQTAWSLMREHQLEYLPVVNKQGTVVGLVTQARLFADLDQLVPEAVSEEGDRPSTDQALSFLQDSLQTLVESLPYMIVRLDRQFRYCYVSPNVEQVCGIPPQRFLGKTLREVGFSDEICDEFEAAASQALKMGETVSFENHFAGKDYITRLIPERLTNGTVRALIGISVDISESKQLTLALEASQSDLHRIFDVAAAAICSFRVFANRDWEYEYFSKQCESLYGYSISELMSDKSLWLSQVPTEDLETVIMPLFEDFMAERSVTVEYRFRHKDGSLRWLSSSYSSQRVDVDQWVIISVNTDITDRKEVEIARQKSQSRLRFALQATQTMYFEHDLKTNQVCHTSIDSDQDVHSIMSIEEMFEHAHPEDQERATLAVKSAIAHQIPLNIEFRIRCPHETRWSWKLVRGVVLFNQQEQPERLIGVSIDITDRKNIELALDELTRELQMLYDEAPCGYHSLDKEGRIIRINKTELEMLGYSWDEVMGRKITNFLTPESAKDFSQNYPTFIKNGSFADQQSQFVRKDGSILTVRISSTAIYDPSGNYLLSRSILMDVNERAALEAERDRIAAELAVSEEQRQLALDLAHTAFWDWDVKTGACSWSDNLFMLLGLPLGMVEASYAVWQVCVHPEDLERVEATIRDGWQNNRLSEEEYRVIHADDSVHWLMSKGQAVYDEAGNPVRMLGITMDISDRKAAELAQKENDALLRLALDATQTIFWQRDLTTDLISYTNPTITAETNQNIPVDLAFERMHPDDQGRVALATERAIAQREPLDLECRVQDADSKEWLWFLIRGIVTQDSAGNPHRLLGVAVNITDRKLAELKLQQQATRDQLITEISQDIRQSLDLNEVLSRSVEGVREILQSDRVILFQMQAEGQGTVVKESVEASGTSIPFSTLGDPCFGEHDLEAFRQGRISTIDDLETANVETSYAESLRKFQVRSCLIVPILHDDHLWGLLISHHCVAPHQWQTAEIELVQELSGQIQIAIQQSELYHQLQSELAERKRIQFSLQASEERFRALCKSAPIGIFQTDASCHCFYTNKHWQELSGLSYEESLGLGWIEAVHPEDRPALFQAWDDYLQSKGEFSHEFRLLSPKGDIRWLGARVAEMHTVSGETIGYVGTNIDLTDRKLAENALRQNQQQLQAILDNSPAAIYLADPDNRLILANRYIADILATTLEEVLDKRVSDLWPPEIAEALIANNQKVRDTRQVLQTEEVVLQVDGLHTYITVKFPVIDDSGEVYAVGGISTDITEKKQLETQYYRAQRLESLGILASGIAHDLNNILTPILAIAQLLPLKYPDVDERTRELISTLEISARRGAEIVKQILSFTRGNGSSRINLQVAHLLTEVFRIARRTFPTNIEILLSLPREDLWLVHADATQLHQVLMNLVINARDAMPEGGHLTIAAENIVLDEQAARLNFGAQAGPYVRFSITDTGCGIDPKLQEHIFDPFFTTKAVNEGTGLGLSTVQGIVNHHAGFIHVSSELGQGSQLSVYLPAADHPQAGSPTEP